MKHLVIYIHGKGGSAKEAEHYQKLLTKSDVIGFDYQSQNPWDARTEFSHFYELHSRGYDAVTLIANSIGAYFSMSALAEKKISTALFISPIVDMEKVIANMMLWAGVTEEELWGVENRRLEMLFLTQAERGKGIGRRLLQYGICHL